MPYRLFRPEAAGKLPLLMYLHGSGGLGDDNLKQLGLGNIFGTRVLAASGKPEAFSVLRRVTANRSGMGQIRFLAGYSESAENTARLRGRARLALEIVERLCMTSPSTRAAFM